MQILALIVEKGGSGKTKIALGLAVDASLAGRAVALIALAPQAAAAKWSDRRGEEAPAVVSCQVGAPGVMAGKCTVSVSPDLLELPMSCDWLIIRHPHALRPAVEIRKR